MAEYVTLKKNDGLPAWGGDNGFVLFLPCEW